MSNLLDYISWRGDLEFTADPCNEVDNFIFCMASYVDFNRTYESYNPSVKISVKEAAKSYCNSFDIQAIKLFGGSIIPWEKIKDLLCKMGNSRRFANVGISDFVNEVDYNGEMQFSAVTYHLSKDEMFIAFRGTDGTLVGWKEDFRLAYLETVPAQKRAVRYLEYVANKYPEKKFYVGGHSKGGNLAKYSAIYATPSVSERILQVFNNDGPGFLRNSVDPEQVSKIERRIKNFIPQSSLVGQMLEHNGQEIIVKSNYIGVYQHDIFGWEIIGNHAVKLKKFTRTGEINREIFGIRINAMSIDERKEFIDTFCRIIDALDAKTIGDLSEAKIKNTALMIKGFSGLEKEKKQLMLDVLSRLLHGEKS